MSRKKEKLFYLVLLLVIIPLCSLSFTLAAHAAAGSLYSTDGGVGEYADPEEYTSFVNPQAASVEICADGYLKPDYLLWVIPLGTFTYTCPNQ